MPAPLAALEARLAGLARPLLASGAVRVLGLAALCAAYLQGGLNKLVDLPGAMAEMAHFGLAPAAPFAAAVIVLELGASALILSGVLRWLGALALCGFTLLATLLALRFWEMPDGPARVMAANAFFEHLGLAGGFLLVACWDLRERAPGEPRLIAHRTAR